MSNKLIKPLTLAVGAAFVGSVSLTQIAHASNNFQLNQLNSGYMIAENAKAPGDKGKEGKCGEGKCGVAKMDTNKDGKVSKAEADAAHAQHFDQMDTNKDGFVDQAEWDAGHKGKEGSCGADKKGKEGSCGADKKGKEGSCGADKKGKEGSCGGHFG